MDTGLGMPPPRSARAAHDLPARDPSRSCCRRSSPAASYLRPCAWRVRRDHHVRRQPPRRHADPPWPCTSGFEGDPSEAVTLSPCCSRRRCSLVPLLRDRWLRTGDHVTRRLTAQVVVDRGVPARRRRRGRARRGRGGPRSQRRREVDVAARGVRAGADRRRADRARRRRRRPPVVRRVGRRREAPGGRGVPGLPPFRTCPWSTTRSARARPAAPPKSRDAAREWIARFRARRARRPQAGADPRAARRSVALARRSPPTLRSSARRAASTSPPGSTYAGSCAAPHDYAGPLLVTHDPLDALVLADRIVVLEDGVITQQGSRSTSAPTGDAVHRRLLGLNLLRGVPRAAIIAVDGGGQSLHAPGTEAHGDVLVAVRLSAVMLHAERARGQRAQRVGRRRRRRGTDRSVRVTVRGAPDGDGRRDRCGRGRPRTRSGGSRLALDQGHRARGSTPIARPDETLRRLPGDTLHPSPRGGPDEQSLLRCRQPPRDHDCSSESTTASSGPGERRRTPWWSSRGSARASGVDADGVCSRRATDDAQDYRDSHPSPP